MEQRASYSSDLQAREEAYYADFWSTDKWGGREPSNIDERNRAEGIVSLIRRRVVPAFGGRRDLRILDVGCGRGWLTNRLAVCGSVTGLDPVTAAIERARTLFPELSFRSGYSDELLAEIGDRAFDLVVSSEVIEHIPSDAKPAFVTSLFRLLRPGGFLILTTPRGNIFPYWSEVLRWPRQPVEEWVTERELRRRLEAAGFRVTLQKRIWIPKIRYNFAARLVCSRPFQLAVREFPRLLQPVQNRFGFYQLILAQRP
jgi:2-polyprenyl-3-methyl-5-hydroxy-6-metoxy-1,4-benzoquinol methylase